MYIHSYYNKISWSSLKSAELKLLRGVSFEEIVGAEFIAKIGHPGRENQSLLLFRLNDYVWVVPCVAQDDSIFLKTLFPSRKYTKIWRTRWLS